MCVCVCGGGGFIVTLGAVEVKYFILCLTVTLNSEMKKEEKKKKRKKKVQEYWISSALGTAPSSNHGSDPVSFNHRFPTSFDYHDLISAQHQCDFRMKTVF